MTLLNRTRKSVKSIACVGACEGRKMPGKILSRRYFYGNIQGRAIHKAGITASPAKDSYLPSKHLGRCAPEFPACICWEFCSLSFASLFPSHSSCYCLVMSASSVAPMVEVVMGTHLNLKVIHNVLVPRHQGAFDYRYIDG